jgi:putative membrane protein
MSYDLVRGLHILSVIAWMAGLLYLPRLFAYHTRASAGSEMDQTFQTMELKLYRFIMGPAMVAAWLFGLGLIWIRSGGLQHPQFLAQPWMLTKFVGIAFMTWWHHFLGRARKRFAAHTNARSEKFWRAVNELPFVAAIIMVLAVTTEFGS